MPVSKKFVARRKQQKFDAKYDQFEKDQLALDNKREHGGSHTASVPSLIEIGKGEVPLAGGKISYQASRGDDGRWYVSTVGPAGRWTMDADEAAVTAAALALAVAECLKFAAEPTGPVEPGIDR